MKKNIKRLSMLSVDHLPIRKHCRLSIKIKYCRQIILDTLGTLDILGILGILGIFFLFLGCAASQDKLIEQYSEFGIKAAQAGLWNESIMRWKRVLELDPNNAAAHNNLGVAYEAQGKYEEAIAEYNKAIELDPNNKNYKKNYLKCQRNYAKLENNTQNNKENNKENNKVSPGQQLHD